METFEKYKRTFEKIDFKEITEKAFKENEDKILRVQRNQLWQGVNSEGNAIQTYDGGYAPATIEIKKAKGLPTNRVTVYDEGDYYKSLKTEIVPEGLQIEGDEQKENGKISDNIAEFDKVLGLSDKYLNYLRKDFYSVFQKSLRSQLHLT